MDENQKSLLASGVAEWDSALKHLRALHEMGLRDASGHPELEAEFKILLDRWRSLMWFDQRIDDEGLVLAARAYLSHQR